MITIWTIIMGGICYALSVIGGEKLIPYALGMMIAVNSFCIIVNSYLNEKSIKFGKQFTKQISASKIANPEKKKEDTKNVILQSLNKGMSYDDILAMASTHGFSNDDIVSSFQELMNDGHITMEQDQPEEEPEPEPEEVQIKVPKQKKVKKKVKKKKSKK